jgi:hypothetical protein
VPRMFVKDLQAVLPEVDMTGLLIAPTCQKAAMDLVATGSDVATEKDRLLEKVRRRVDFGRVAPPAVRFR